MSVNVRVPMPLRKLTNGEDVVVINGSTIGECLSTLEDTYPGFKERLMSEDGGIRHFINLYVNGEDVRFLNGLDTAVKQGDEISIVPAVAGGCETL